MSPNYLRSTPETRKPLFPNRNYKKSIFWSFLVKSYDDLKNFNSQAEISYETKVVPFDQMKVSERCTEPRKNCNVVFSKIIEKTYQIHIIQK